MSLVFPQFYSYFSEDYTGNREKKLLTARLLALIQPKQMEGCAMSSVKYVDELSGAEIWLCF